MKDAKMTGRTMEEICDEYFASMNPIAYKIIEEKRKCMDKNKKNWERLTQDEKDSLLDAWFLDRELKIRYEIRLHGKLPSNKDAPPESFPRLKVQGGTKTVQHTEHDDDPQSKGNTITWKDEFSGPFSWETKCQQDLPMISPASITAASTRNGDAVGDDYSENRLSMGLDADDESQLIVVSAPSKSGGKSKDPKRASDSLEKPDKTWVGRKDREREKENGGSSIVQHQPRAAPSPLADPSLDPMSPPPPSLTDKNGRVPPRREKSDKAKGRHHHSGKSSPKRESRPRERNVDQEDLIPSNGGRGEDTSLEGINFSLEGLGSTESDGAVPATTSPSSNLTGRTFGLVGSMEAAASGPLLQPPSSPPASATSQSSDQASAAGKEEEGGSSFDFLLAW